MRYIVIQAPTTLSNSEQASWGMTPSGEIIELVNGMTLPAGTVVGIHPDVETHTFIDKSLDIHKLSNLDVFQGSDSQGNRGESVNGIDSNKNSGEPFSVDERTISSTLKSMHSNSDDYRFDNHDLELVDISEFGYTSKDFQYLSEQTELASDEADEESNSGVNAGATNYTMDEDGTITLTQEQLLANSSDVEGNALTVTSLQLDGSDANVVNNLDGTWTITPSEDWNGTLNLTATVSDGQLSAPANVTIEVTPLPDNVIYNGTGVINAIEDTPVDLGLNLDTSKLGNTETLESSIAGLPIGSVVSDGVNSITITQDNQNADLTDWDINAIAVTPPDNFYGEISAQITIITTEQTTTNTTTTVIPIVINVTNTDDAPIIGDSLNFSVNEDESITLTQEQLLANASDADGNALSADNLNVSGNAQVTANEDGTFTITPDEHFHGVLAISYDISDGTDTIPADMTLDVLPINDAPEIAATESVFSDTQIEAGIAIDVSQSNLLSTATDVDDHDTSLVITSINGDVANVGSPTTVTLNYIDADGVGQTQEIEITVNADGSYSIDGFNLDALPHNGQATTEFTYQVMDDEGLVSDTETSTLTIAGSNHAPELIANHNTFTESSLESGIVIDANTSNLLSAASDIDDVDTSLTVASVNGDTTSVGSPIIVTFAYVDADGVDQTQDVELTLNADGSYAVTGFDLDALPEGSVASGTFDYAVQDDQGAVSNAVTSTIEITGTNDNPELVARNNTNSEDNLEVGINVSAADSNLLEGASDSDDVDVSLTVASVNGEAISVGSATIVTLNYVDADGVDQTQDVELTLNGDGSYSIAGFDLDNLPDGSIASGTFDYAVQDDQGAVSNAVTSTIEITGTNDNPELVAQHYAYSESSLESGINVSSADSLLLSQATDSDDIDGSLTIGSVNGQASNLGQAVALTLFFNDADGVAQTQDVNLTVNADGSYSIDAFDLDALPDGATASGTFTYQAVDDDGALSNTVTSTIEVSGTNDNPQLVASDNGFTEDQLEAGIAVWAGASNLLDQASDVDGASGTLQIGTVNGSAANVLNPVVVRLNYTDADGNAQSQDVNLTVNSDGSYAINAFDLDALPNGASATGTFSYQVLDREGALSNTSIGTIEIFGTNDNPVLTAQTNTFTEDNLEVGLSVSANASNLLSGATDIDDMDSTLSIGTVNGAAVNVGSAVVVTLNYTDADGQSQTQSVDLTVNQDGSYSVAAFDFDVLPLGETATGVFDYQVIDDDGQLSNTVTSTIEITGTNDDPTLIAQNNGFSEGALEFGINVDAATSNLLDGAVDVDGATGSLQIGTVNGDAANVLNPVVLTLSYTDADGIAHTQDVNLTINPDGSYSIDAFDLDQLPAGSAATGTFTYQVLDDSGTLSNTVTSTLEIFGTNDAPQATATANGFTEDMLENGVSVSANASNLLSTGTDIDDIDSSLTVGTVNGSAVNVGVAVTVNLSYTDIDGNLQIQPVNVTVHADGSYDIAGFDLDSLPDGSVATGVFHYQVSDDDGALSTNVVSTIEISGTNDNPELVASNNLFNEDQLQNGINVAANSSNLLSGATDADDLDSSLVISSINGVPANVGVPVTLALAYTDADGNVQNQDVNLTVNADGSYAIDAFDFDALPFGNLATGTFTYQVSDDQGGTSGAATSTIQLFGTNDAPQLTMQSNGFTEDMLENGVMMPANASNL
ncbi:MAG: beta strand repeat-containing protein, partial [Colwellia sp.]